MKIVSAASAYPKHYYSQEVLASAFQAYWAGRLDNPQMVERLHARTGVDGRFLALPMEGYLALDGWGDANNAWIRTADELGQSAMCQALARAGLQALDLDALIFVSITGVSSPSIDARLGQPAWASPRGSAACRSSGWAAWEAPPGWRAPPTTCGPTRTTSPRSLSVEICSLTLQKDDVSVANLISSGLFGDGAVAVMVAGADCDTSRSRDSRFHFHVLSGHRRCHGLGHFREGIPNCPVAAGARRNPRTSRSGRGRLPGRSLDSRARISAAGSCTREVPRCSKRRAMRWGSTIATSRSHGTACARPAICRRPASWPFSRKSC